MGLSTQGWVIVSPWGDVIGMPHRTRAAAIMEACTNYDKATYDAVIARATASAECAGYPSLWPIPSEMTPEARAFWRKQRRAGWIAAHCYIDVADCRVPKP